MRGGMFLLSVIGAAGLAAVSAGASMDALGDADLVSRADAVLGAKESPADRIIGVHRNLRVIVDVLCTFGCPANSVRIIRYEVPAGPLCTKAGADTVTIEVPRGMMKGPQEFCVPHILVSRKLYTDKPYQK